MTSEEIIKVAHIVAEYINDKRLLGDFSNKICREEEQNILDRYYNLYGMQEEDIKQAMDQITDEQWYEQAERIR